MLTKRVIPVMAALAVVVGALVAVAPTAVADPPAIAPALPPGGSFVPVAPKRVLDTRSLSGPVTSTTAQVAAGLPGVALASVSAVLLNVTVVNASGAGYVTVAGPVGTSNGNYVKGAASATLALVRVGPAGTVAITTSASANVVVDVQGYVTTAAAATDASFTPLASPVRIADSRSGQGLTPFDGLSTQPLSVRSLAGLPADATAVIANVTIASATASTYVTAWAGGLRPTVSTVNAGAGQIVANRALIPLDTAGQALFFNAGGTTNLVVDVVGYLAPDPAGSYYSPITVGRLADVSATRSVALRTTVDPGATGGPVLAPSVADLAPTTAVWLTLVGDHPVGRGYLTARPDDVEPTATSDLDLVPGRAVANAGPVRVSDADGVVRVTSSAQTRIVADLSGWFRQRATAAADGLWLTVRYPDYTDTPTRTDTQLADGLPAYFAGAVFAGQGVRTPTNAYAIASDSSVQQASYGSSLPGGVEQWGAPRRVGQLTAIDGLTTAGNTLTAATYAWDLVGQVWGFQSNRYGELGTQPSPTITYPLAPTKVPLPLGVLATAVFAAPGVGYAVGADGTVYSWGRADTGQLGRAPTSTPWVPTAVPGLTAPTAVAGDGRVTFAIDSDGATSMWGTPVGGTAQATPTAFAAACATGTSLHADVSGVWELCDDGTVVQLSRLGAVSATVQTLAVSGVSAIGAGAGYDNGIRVLTDDGRVADVPSVGPARSEAGFADVTAVTGSPGVQLTQVVSSG